jgi:fibronectin-binding autotransporter adhesin
MKLYRKADPADGSNSYRESMSPKLAFGGGLHDKRCHGLSSGLAIAALMLPAVGYSQIVQTEASGGTTTEWNDAIWGTPAAVPTNGNAYQTAAGLVASSDTRLGVFVTGRVRAYGGADGNPTFAGSSLSVVSGTELLIKSTGTTYAANLLLNGGVVRFAPNDPGGNATLTGTLNVGAESYLGVVQGAASVFTVNSTLTGSSLLHLAAGDGNSNSLIFGGDLSGYTGTFDIGGGNTNVGTNNRRVTVGFSQAYNLPSLRILMGAHGTTDVLSLDHDLTVGSLSSTTGNAAIQGGASAGTRTLSTGALGLTESFSGSISNGSGGTLGLTKIGAGTLTLSGTNSYTGNTTVSGGKLLVNSSTAAGSAVTVSAGTVTGTPVASLGGTGTISGNLALSAESATGFKNGGILAPTASASGTKLSVTGTTNFSTGSIFEWDLNAATSDTGNGATNTGNYGQLAGSGAITGSDAVFQIVLGSNRFSDAFWNTNKSWTNIFTGSGATTNLATIFSGGFGGDVATSGLVSGRGSFGFSGTSTLTWTAVPEPTSALAGVLICAGMFRRRRH